MLKRLRRKFVLIITALVGAVLVAVLGGSLWAGVVTQRQLTSEALDRGLEGDIHDAPTMFTAEPEERTDERRANMFVLCVDISPTGMVLASNRSTVLIDEDTLDATIQQALSTDAEEGRDSSLHIAWKRSLMASGAYRVAMTDTSAADLALERQLAQDVAIIAMGVGVLFAISWGLSSWVLRPVSRAWDQQKQFVADASHELKTPLAVIIANTDILVRDASIPQESMRWVESTQDEARHMRGLVEELLELARADETKLGDGSAVMHEETVNLSELVEDGALEYDAVAYEHGSTIEDHIEEGVTVRGDREWLQRLVKILIENACKYTEGGRPIRISLSREGRQCTYSVTNWGNAIDPDELPHVFDRFFRSDKARSRGDSASGFGLGLAIAKGIATSHRGSITATSDEEAGTTFEVTLPLA